MASPIQGRASRSSQRRPSGRSSSQSPMPASSSAAVYLLSSASPAKTPAASHHHPLPPVTIRAMAQRVAIQNRISGVSGVIRIPPAPKSSVAFSRSAAA